MHGSRWLLLGCALAGCWRRTAPAAVEVAPQAPQGCRIRTEGVASNAAVSAAPGERPFLNGFGTTDAVVAIASGADGTSWLPLTLASGGLTIRGSARARDVPLFLTQAQLAAGIVMIGSSEELSLARGHGEHVDLRFALPKGVTFVDPDRAYAPHIACRDLQAFIVGDTDNAEALGIHLDRTVLYRFTVPQVPMSSAPGGPHVATFDTTEPRRTAHLLDERAPFSRVWVDLDDDGHDLALVGWIPRSALAVEATDHGTGGFGIGGLGAGMRKPVLRRCATRVPVALVRVGQPGKTVVGELAPQAAFAITDDPDVPAGAIALARPTTNWLNLADEARLVVDAALVSKCPVVETP